MKGGQPACSVIIKLGLYLLGFLGVWVFFFLNETEHLIAPSSGGFSACFLTLSDFTRSS